MNVAFPLYLHLYLSQRMLTYITKTRLFQIIENFTTKKGKFSDKNSDNFHISAQNIDEAVLTSTHKLCFSRNKKNNVYPCKPQFYYIKVEFKGVKII